MKKSIVRAVIIVLIVVGIIAGIKALQIRAMINMKPPFKAETVTSYVVQKQRWESVLSAVGSLAAVQGVTVAAELAGKIAQIPLEPGTMVNEGDLLVQQDISAETAQLRSADAALELARVNFKRAERLLSEQTYSRSEYDNAEAQLKQAAAQVDNIKSAISKKTIRAPFRGALGIRLVNLGQMLSAGDAIISLQSLDPVYANFSLPQQQLTKLKPGLKVRIKSDAVPGTEFEGEITAINPQVETSTRNIMVQATVQNPGLVLRPGMFVNVTVVLPGEQDVLAVPGTSILNAPYSDSVFIIEKAPQDGPAEVGTVVRQQFVRLGRRQGDFVSVLAGLEEGDTVVSTGAFKLRNGMAVTVDNTLAPEFHTEPTPHDR